MAVLIAIAKRRGLANGNGYVRVFTLAWLELCIGYARHLNQRSLKVSTTFLHV